MAYFFLFMLVSFAALIVWSSRRGRGRSDRPHAPVMHDPKSDPETRRYGSSWY